MKPQKILKILPKCISWLEIELRQSHLKSPGPKNIMLILQCHTSSIKEHWIH